MVSTTKQSGQAEECTVSKMSALKKEYRQLWKQMAELDQEWIRKHNKLSEMIAEAAIASKENWNELCDSIPQRLVKRTIGYYEVEIEDEVQ